MSPPGGASLDGEPPASAIVAARTAAGRCFRPVPARAAARGPGGVAIADSSARRLPVSTLFASSRACDIVSDVLCRGVPRTERRLSTPPSPLRFPPPRPASAAASSKAAPSADQDAFHRPSAPSPCRAGRFRACAWDHEEPATGLAARVLAAFAAAIRLPAPVRGLRPRLPAGDQPARPSLFRARTERRSSTSATNTIREHRRADRPIPVFPRESLRWRALSRFAAVQGELGSPPGTVFSASAGGTVDARAWPKPRAHAVGFSGRVFTGQGQVASRRPARSSLSFDRPEVRGELAGSPGTTLYPDPIRSDTSRREPVAGVDWRPLQGRCAPKESSTLRGVSGGGNTVLRSHLARSFR